MSTPTGRIVKLLLVSSLLAHGAAAQTWQAVATPAAGSTGTLTVLASALLPNGELAVAGTFDGTITLGASTLTSAGGLDIVVARLSATGTWLQAVRAGGPDSDQATAIAVAPNGEIVVAGQFASAALGLGPFTLANPTPATTDGFVARLTPALVWAQGVRLGGLGDDYVTGVGVSGAGAATVVGSFRSSQLTAGALTLPNTGNGTHDGFVARLTAAGLWDQLVSIGGSDDELAEAVAVTVAGEAVVVGSFASASAAFGSATLTNAEPAGQEADAFVARLSAAGTWTQAVRLGAAGGDYLRAVQLDAAGGAVVAGDFTGATTQAGPFALANTDASGNSSDVLVARLSAAGTWTQAAAGGSSELDYATGLALDAQGGAVVVGDFFGPTLTLGGLSLPNLPSGVGNSHVFVARLSPAGTWAQAAGAGGSQNDYATTVAVDGQFAYVGGAVSRLGGQFGPVAVAPAPTATGFVARLGGLPTAARAAVATELALYPNPVSAGQDLTLTIAGLTNAPVRVELLTMLGQAAVILPGGRPEPGMGGSTWLLRLPTRALAPGLYVVRLTQQQVSTNKMLLVK